MKIIDIRTIKTDHGWYINLTDVLHFLAKVGSVYPSLVVMYIYYQLKGAKYENLEIDHG